MHKRGERINFYQKITIWFVFFFNDFENKSTVCFDSLIKLLTIGQKMPILEHLNFLKLSA